MFRISAQPAPDQFVLKLEGRLTAAWVSEADAYWRASTAERGSRPLVVDLSDLLSIDDAGRELVVRMIGAGAQAIARGCAMRELVRELTAAAARQTDTTKIEEGRQA